MIVTNQINLIRKEAHYKAGFCLLNESLRGLNKNKSLLHLDELNYLKTLKYEARQTSYLLGRIAAKKAISALIPKHITLNSFSIQSGVFQFPVIKHLQYNTNQVCISHCDNIGVALAYPEEHPMGIDIEKIDDTKMDVMESVMSETDKASLHLSELSKSEMLTLLWTTKEALSKILKTGLMIDFKFLEQESILNIDSYYESTFKNFGQYKAVSFMISGYMCSVVLPKNTAINPNQFINECQEVLNSKIT